MQLPRGVVTFLFTDVEGSTRLWDRHPDQMREALVAHDAIVELLADTHDGQVVRPRGEGDSRFCVFARATDAVHAAAAIQRALHAEPWPAETPLTVRLALHTGEADLREGDYYGSAVNRAARIRSLAHGGQTLLSQSTYDLVRDDLPPRTSTADLGEHRLKDLGRPERIFQLVCADLPDSFPPLRSLDSVPNNLPLQVTSFVGREREMAEVARLMADSRLVTLTGAGGTGKTRLALQTAADALDTFPDGVFLVELAPVGDAAQVPQAVASALSIKEEPGLALTETLVAALRGRRVLLLLDNCEHLVEACARLADRLIHTCPTLNILATSREALGIAGESAWRVPSLPSPDPRSFGLRGGDGAHAGGGATDAALAGFTQYEAVRLFVDRAVSVFPGFRVTNQNAPAVAQICSRLDGIPLAIELAAARVKVLSPEQLLTRLEDRFRLLTGGSRTALPRQQTLQALVDWSYSLLSAEEKTLFGRLAVFYGGFTLEAAEEVGAGESPGGVRIESDGVLDLLTRLVEKSLVNAEDSPGDGRRYVLLETLRQYARQRLLDGGEAEAAHDRHAAYFVAFTQQLEETFRARFEELQRTGQRSDGSLTRKLIPVIEADYDNLRAAFRWLVGRRDAARAAEIGWRLIWYWNWHSLVAEEQRWWEELLPLAHLVPPTLRMSLFTRAGYTTHKRGDYARALELHTRMLETATEANDERRIAHAKETVALMHWCLGRTGEALDLLREALAAHQRLGDSIFLATCLRNLSFVLRSQGDLAAARDALQQALAVSERLDSPQNRNRTLAWLGRVAFLEGHLDEAARHLGEALASSRQYGQFVGVEDCLEWIAAVAAARGDAETAARLFGAAATARRVSGQTRWAPDEPVYEADLAASRSALPAGAFDAAWAEGGRMSLDAAVDAALRCVEHQMPTTTLQPAPGRR